MRCRCATEGVGVGDALTIDRMGMDKESTTTYIECYGK